MNPRIALLVATLGTLLADSIVHRAQAADQFFAGDGTGLATAKWGPDGGPFTSTFTAGNVANFRVVAGTGTGGTISVGGINVIESFTITAASGTIGGTAAAVN